MESVINDLRYGARMLWKSRGLTTVAIISLAVGIGANAVIFSLVDSVLLRPRAFAEPERLVQLYSGHREIPYQTSSYPSYQDFRARNDVFTDLAAYGLGWQFKLSGTDDVEQVWGEVVSGSYFDVLGVRPVVGRGFLAEEDSVIGRNPVVVIGHALWQRRFNSDPAIVGRTITVNNQPVTVVGVAPRTHTGMMSGWASEIWVPAMTIPLLTPAAERHVTSRGNKWVTMVGRMKPGVTIEQVRSRFAVLTREMQAAHPREWLEMREEGRPPRENFVSVASEAQTRVHPGMGAGVYAIVALVFAIVDLVLVIACMNLASMLFAKAMARRSEITVRLALGAGRTRIIRQLLTENMLLAFIAAGVGIILALWGVNALMSMIPPLPEGIRVAFNPQIDWRVLSYTIAFAAVTGLLFGLAPALHSSRAALASVLKDESTITARHRKSRVRTLLVVGQVAFSLLLLIGAGLVLRSLDKVRPTRLGFESENIVVAPIQLDERTYDRSRSQQLYRELSDRVAALPGVQAVSLIDGVPGGFTGGSRRSVAIEGYTPPGEEGFEIAASIVGPKYFTNMKVPILAGRDFTETDREGAPCVAIVNEPFAQRYLRGTSTALGKRLTRGQANAPDKVCAVVGVIRDNEWQSLNKQVRPFYALALQQEHMERMTLMAQTTGDPRALMTAMKETIRSIDRSLPVADVQTLGQFFGVAAYPFRLLGFIIGGCGLMALFLATLGIYGTVSYSVVQRNREVGIRMALGAVQRDILRMVVGQGMTVVSYGLALGLLLGFALTRVLVSLPLDMPLLFGISATDALTFIGVTATLGLVALVACLLPAQRAARVDPMVTLRNAW